MLAVPAFGQVQREVAAAGPGGAGGDVDQVAAQRGAAGSGVGQAGQGAGGAQQVVRDGSAGRPGRIGGERARWHVRERPVGDVGEDLFHDGVVAVLPLGLQELYLKP